MLAAAPVSTSSSLVEKGQTTLRLLESAILTCDFWSQDESVYSSLAFDRRFFLVFFVSGADGVDKSREKAAVFENGTSEPVRRNSQYEAGKFELEVASQRVCEQTSLSSSGSPPLETRDLYRRADKALKTDGDVLPMARKS